EAEERRLLLDTGHLHGPGRGQDRPGRLKRRPHPAQLHLRRPGDLQEPAARHEHPDPFHGTPTGSLPVLLQVPPAGDAGLADSHLTAAGNPPGLPPYPSTTPAKEGAIVSSFRPPRRSGWRAPWVSGVLAVLVAAALAGAGAAAGAQESAPDGGDTATTVADPSSDSTAPD